MVYELKVGRIVPVSACSNTHKGDKIYIPRGLNATKPVETLTISQYSGRIFTKAELLSSSVTKSKKWAYIELKTQDVVIQS